MSWLLGRLALMQRIRLFVAFFLFATLPASMLFAQSDPQLAEIRQLIFAAQFSEAIQGAESYLQRPDLAAAERNAGLEVLAIAQLANRQNRRADATLRELYRRDPEHRLSDPDASPPVIAAFGRAHESRRDTITVRMQHEAVAGNSLPSVTVQIEEGAGAVDEVRLHHRLVGQGDWNRLAMTATSGASYRSQIPVERSSAASLEIRIEAVAPSGAVLSELGSEASPLVLSLPAVSVGGGAGGIVDSGGGGSGSVPGGSPSDPGDDAGGGSDWWIWALIGVAVVGAAAGVTLFVLDPFGPPTGTLGSAQLGLIEF